jgi:hypothetical protein
MSRWIVSLLVVVLAVGVCVAQQATAAPDAPATPEQIHKMFDLLSSQAEMDQMMDSMLQPMIQTMRQTFKQEMPNATPEELSKMESAMHTAIKEVRQAYPREEMLQDLTPIYQKHFTKSDLDGVIAFYSSPSGQKFRKEMPAMVGEFMQVMMPKAVQRMQPVMKKMEEDTREMAKNMAQQRARQNQSPK